MGIKSVKSPLKQQDVYEGFSADLKSNITLFYLILSYIFHVHTDDVLILVKDIGLLSNKESLKVILDAIPKIKERIYITNAYKFIDKGVIKAYTLKPLG